MKREEIPLELEQSRITYAKGRLVKKDENGKTISAIYRADILNVCLSSKNEWGVGFFLVGFFFSLALFSKYVIPWGWLSWTGTVLFGLLTPLGLLAIKTNTLSVDTKGGNFQLAVQENEDLLKAFVASVNTQVQSEFTSEKTPIPQEEPTPVREPKVQKMEPALALPEIEINESAVSTVQDILADVDEISNGEKVPVQNYQIDFSLSGPHCLGGSPPLGYKAPSIDRGMMYQCVGMISAKEKPFLWLEKDLFLYVPLYYRFAEIYIDYSNRKTPKVVKSLGLEPLAEFSFLGKYDRVEFEELHFGISEIQGPGEFGTAHWHSDEKFPRCPKSDEGMEFVCSLPSHIGPLANARSLRSLKNEEKALIEKMKFAGNADLKVFYNAESQVAAYFLDQKPV